MKLIGFPKEARGPEVKAQVFYCKNPLKVSHMGEILTLIKISLDSWLPCPPIPTHRDGVDVGLVAGECLLAHSLTDVPQFGRGVAGARDECAHVRRQGQRHHVAGVAREGGHLLPRLNVPEGTAKCD
jgi:hypothetical protein